MTGIKVTFSVLIVNIDQYPSPAQLLGLQMDADGDINLFQKAKWDSWEHVLAEERLQYQEMFEIKSNNTWESLHNSYH